MPLVRQLVAAGHEVTGTTRREERAGADRGSGRDGRRSATPSTREALERAVSEAAPEVVVHAMTSLPDRINYRSRRTFAATNRLRSEGTRNLIGGSDGRGRTPSGRRERRLPLRAAGRLGEGGGRAAAERPSGAHSGRGRGRSTDLERQVLGQRGTRGRRSCASAAFYGPRTSMAPGRAMADGCAQEARSGRRRGHRQVLFHPRRGRRRSDGRRGRGPRDRRLQHRRRRARRAEDLDSRPTPRRWGRSRRATSRSGWPS